MSEGGRLHSAGKLIVISGPSGAGKGTLIAGVLKASDRFAVAVSATTRPRRPGEEHGRESDAVALRRRQEERGADERRRERSEDPFHDARH